MPKITIDDLKHSTLHEIITDKTDKNATHKISVDIIEFMNNNGITIHNPLNNLFTF